MNETQGVLGFPRYSAAWHEAAGGVPPGTKNKIDYSGSLDFASFVSCVLCVPSQTKNNTGMVPFSTTGLYQCSLHVLYGLYR